MNKRPQSWEELRRMDRAEATEAVPDHLRELVDEKKPPVREIHFVERPKPTEGDKKVREALTLEGYRPPWQVRSFAPRRARSAKPPTVLHHDQLLEPAIIYAPDE